MTLSRGRKFALLAGTVFDLLLAVATMTVSSLQFVWVTQAQYELMRPLMTFSEAPPAPDPALTTQMFGVMIAMTAITSVGLAVHIAMVAIYVMLVGRTSMPSSERTLWIVALLFVGVLAQAAFLFTKVWTQRRHDSPDCVDVSVSVEPGAQV